MATLEIRDLHVTVEAELAKNVLKDVGSLAAFGSDD